MRHQACLSVARGPLYRAKNTQVLQTVARAHNRFGRATNNRAEILELPRQRVGSFDGDRLAIKRPPPRPLRRIAVKSQAHGWKRQRTKRAGNDVTIFLGIGGKGPPPPNALDPG